MAFKMRTFLHFLPCTDNSITTQVTSSKVNMNTEHSSV